MLRDDGHGTMTLMADPTLPALANGKHRAAQDRCAALVHHARAQILAVGVDRFSVNEVLRAAGGSKATLAKYFGDRAGLIAAAIGAEAADAVAGLDLGSSVALPLEQALERALAGVLRFYCEPGSVALYRAVVSAADPVGAQGFYRAGHGHLVAALAGLLDARKGGEVRADLDSELVADQLLHMVRAGPFEQVLIGLVDQPPAAAEIDRRARQAAALVLPAIAVDPQCSR